MVYHYLLLHYPIMAYVVNILIVCCMHMSVCMCIYVCLQMGDDDTRLYRWLQLLGGLLAMC